MLCRLKVCDPIEGKDEDLEIMPAHCCEIQDFSCNYLGLPLTIQTPTKAEFHPLIDKVAHNLLGRKASIMKVLAVPLQSEWCSSLYLFTL